MSIAYQVPKLMNHIVIVFKGVSHFMQSCHELLTREATLGRGKLS